MMLNSNVPGKGLSEEYINKLKSNCKEYWAQSENDTYYYDMIVHHALTLGMIRSHFNILKEFTEAEVIDSNPDKDIAYGKVCAYNEILNLLDAVMDGKHFL